jgi:hypothetical protein
MNIKEWQKACLNGCAPRKYDNTSREIQKSLKYNSDPRATVRHHLRDTEEQRKYNDEHYELWGFEIDENGNEHFEYGKYMIFVTPEEHAEIHRCSEETRKKLSESLKWIPRTDEWRKKIGESNKGKTIPDEQRKQISESVKNYYALEGSKEKTSKATKEAMQRPDVRQRFLDGCKKRPPISKEIRQKAAEANKAKPLSEGDIIILYKYFNSIMNGRTSLSVRELSEVYHACKVLKISWNTFQKAFREFKHTLS